MTTKTKNFLHVASVIAGAFLLLLLLLRFCMWLDTIEASVSQYNEVACMSEQDDTIKAQAKERMAKGHLNKEDFRVIKESFDNEVKSKQKKLARERITK